MFIRKMIVQGVKVHEIYLEAIKRNDSNTNPGMETVEVRDSAFIVVLEGCADAPDPES